MGGVEDGFLKSKGRRIGYFVVVSKPFPLQRGEMRRVELARVEGSESEVAFSSEKTMEGSSASSFPVRSRCRGEGEGRK